MRWFVLLTIIILSAPVPLCAQELPRKIKPVMVWTGIDSKQTLTEPGIFAKLLGYQWKDRAILARCCTQKEWQAVWDAHCGLGKDKKEENRACIDVDFDSQMLVAIFSDSSRIRIKEIQEEKDCVRLRYEPWGNQTVIVPRTDGNGEAKSIIISDGRGEVTVETMSTPSFAFVILPNFSKAVMLDENVQEFTGKPPVWKERKKFAAIEKK